MSTEDELTQLIDKTAGGDSESGKGLRKRLTAVLDENRELRKEVVTSKAAALIASKGYDLVEVKDLAEDTPIDQIEAKLESLQKDRTDILAKGLRLQFAKQGVAEDEIEAQVTDFLAGRVTSDTPDPEAEQFERVRELAGIAGTPVPMVNTSKLHGGDAIRAGLMAKTPQRR